MRADHTILVVDDHRPGLYAAAKLLQSAGFRTLQASSGTEALHLSPQASALLLDVNLPDVNGLEVCEIIKHSEPKPIVLMSAVFVDPLDQEAGADAGADLYLVWPLDTVEVTSAFDRLLGVLLH